MKRKTQVAKAQAGGVPVAVGKVGADISWANGREGGFFGTGVLMTTTDHWLHRAGPP